METYQQLPNANETTQRGDNFRLQQFSEWLSHLEKELQARENIYKRYKRSRSIFLNISTGRGTMSVALSAGGLGTGLTGVGLPVAVSLVVIGGVCALDNFITGSIAMVISKNVTKPEKTKQISTR